MKRKIKFRAWNTEMKHMVFPSLEFGREMWPYTYKQIIKSETNENGDKIEFVLEMVSIDHILQSTEFEVMQFTGLLDKNGKEIYEGDILCNDDYNTWEWRGVVKFSHGVFGAEWLVNVKSQSMVGSWGQKHNLRKLDDDILERQVIVGNIYENPELLSEPS